MVKPKLSSAVQTNKMDNYAGTKSQAATTSGQMEERVQVESSLTSIMAAIADLRGTIESKIDTVTIEVNLLRADFRKTADKVTMAEGKITQLETTTGNLEAQAQQLKQQQCVMAARLEDEEGRAQRNNISVGVPEKMEGQSVDLFLEDLIFKPPASQTTVYLLYGGTCAQSPHSETRSATTDDNREAPKL